MATFEWKISNAERDKATGGVKKVWWSCLAFEGTVGVEKDGVATFSPNPSDSGFVAYEALTRELMMGWVHGPNDAHKIAVEAELGEKLQEMLSPSTATGLPWTIG
jgi:hypothetical protein